MAGLNTSVDIGSKLSKLAGAWDEFSDRDFAGAVQFSLNGVGIDEVNPWRRAASNLFDRPTDWTLKAVRYDVDRAALAAIQTADEASTRVYVLPDRSSVLKYGFGEGHRHVGIESWFPNQGQIYITVEDGLARTQNIMPNAFGNYSGRAVKKLAVQLAAGYSRNTTGKSKWGVFDIKAGIATPRGLASASMPGRRVGRRWSTASASSAR